MAAQGLHKKLDEEARPKEHGAVVTPLVQCWNCFLPRRSGGEIRQCVTVDSAVDSYSGDHATGDDLAVCPLGAMC